MISKACLACECFLPPVLRMYYLLVLSSISLGSFRKDKIHMIAKFHMAELVIWGHSREGKTRLIPQ